MARTRDRLKLLPAPLGPSLAIALTTCCLGPLAVGQVPQPPAQSSGKPVVGKPATSKAIPRSQRGLDSVRLSDGKLLLGFTLQAAPPGTIQFAVPKDWLENRYPGLFKEKALALQQSYNENKEQLTKRIEQWLNQEVVAKAKDGVIKRVLEDELKQIVSKDFDIDSIEFIPLSLTRNDYKKLEIAKPDHRKIGGLAYQFDLDNVETRPAYALRRELESLNVDIETEKVDLSDQLPSLASDSQKQWNARQAIYEHNYVKPLEFQGTRQSHFRTDKETSTATLLAQLTSQTDQISQIGRELGLPEFSAPQASAKWWEKACQEAESEGHRGVAFKIVESSMNQQVATVEIYFFFRDDSGEWNQLAKFAAQANAADQKQEQIDELAQQPQVQEIIKMTAGLGIDMSDRLTLALRYGAACRQALSQATGEFQLFLGKYLNRLDGPALPKL